MTYPNPIPPSADPALPPPLPGAPMPDIADRADPPCAGYSSGSAPSLRAPWLQALIRAGAQMAGADWTAPSLDDESELSAHIGARDAVQFVRCTRKASSTEPDFLATMAQARRLVALGARRIVFLTDSDQIDDQLYRSLQCFARHSGRALNKTAAEFAVIPVHHPEAARSL